MCPVWARRSLGNCLSGMFQLQRFTENHRASKDREHYSGWAVPYSLSNHTQLNSTKIRATKPGFGPYFPLWKRQLLEFPVIRYSLQSLKPNTPRDPTMALAWLRHQITHQKNPKQITLGWSWHTHTQKSRNSISETEIIGRQFFKTTHFRIAYLCKERIFYLEPFSPLETKSDRTKGRIPFANYNILSQICLQQVLYLQKLVRLYMFVNWGKPTLYSPASPLFFISF